MLSANEIQEIIEGCGITTLTVWSRKCRSKIEWRALAHVAKGPTRVATAAALDELLLNLREQFLKKEEASDDAIHVP